MYLSRDSGSGGPEESALHGGNEPEDRPAEFETSRVLAVVGSQASVGLPLEVLRQLEDEAPTVGKFLGIKRGRSLLVGMVTEVSVQAAASGGRSGYQAIACVDLLGEIEGLDSAAARFHRGVSTYPAIGDPAMLIGTRELRIIYDTSRANTIDVGSLHQDSAIGAYLKVDDLISKHFALLGTTGVGKSSGMALILNEMLAARPDLRVFLLDVHNEYGRCFGDRAVVLNPRNLKLPFWLFNFEEFIDVIFGARPGIEEEVEILAELIPQAKNNYAQSRAPSDRPLVRRTDQKAAGFTADTPVPYRLDELARLIDERLGRLENRASRLKYQKVMTRIELVRNDPRYGFMFDSANVGGDTMADVLKQLFRLTPDGKAMSIMQLAGFPAEVLDSVVSVLCRMAFDFGLWSDGAVPLLFVCEEAHRYASADHSIGFGPTRRALSRIAKEGRKYGTYLGLVTQRPAELDATIISQCNTLLAMRLANDRDQALLRSAVSDAAANLLGFVSSLGTGEVLAFGEGVALPARLKFRELPKEFTPRGEALRDRAIDIGAGDTDELIDAAIERWRGATMSPRRRGDNTPGAMRETPTEAVEPEIGGHADRHGLLRRASAGRIPVR
jgi:DNA helicase HerA-like ATPase